VIVSCEACKSRYKLDDSKVGGKGARITCPKCKHVFIVQIRDADGPTVPPLPPVRPPAAPPTPERVTGGGLVVPPPAPSAPIVPSSEAELRSEPPTEERAARGDLAARAALLDFRKVGVTTWKVKVKIGLIYDFSDIKTLRKYITDGRVTSGDVISYDGKTWRKLGEIPDLDAFFVETWESLAATYTEPEPSAPKAVPPPASEDLSAAAAAAMAAEMDEETSAPRAVRRGPSASSSSPARPRTAGRKPETQQPAASRAPWVGVAVAGAFMVAGVVAWRSREEPPPAPPLPPVAAAPAPAATSPADATAQLNRELEERLRNAERAPVASGPDQLAWTPVNRAAEAARPLPPGGMAPVAQAPAAKDASASDHEAVGDDAVRGGDWSTAAVAFRKAVALDPRNARLQFKMGEALLKSGDTVGAMAPLLDAANRGQMRAWRLLGDAARAQGDVAGANAHYQKYLATQPGDAAEVRALLGSGG
jgi:predicted Zn finger-like uncharacterized protein